MNIKNILKKIPFLRRFLKKAYLKNRSEIYAGLSESAKTDEKLIVFESFQGRSYSCSPKAIYEYMIGQERFSSYRFVWVFREKDAHGTFPENTTIVKYDSEESFKAYAKAKWWIVNSRLRDFIVPREDQCYIQCWHGTPFKKIGCDVSAGGNATSTVEEIYNEYKTDSEKISKFISPSDFTTEKLISAFALPDSSKIIQQGYPRNDALADPDEGRIKRLRDELCLPEGKKVLLYCPTFRDNSYGSSGYTFSIELDLDSLKEKFGEDIIILFRAHYFIADNFDFEKYGGFVRNVSACDDINDLLLVSDILMTDYSSVFFDFANLRRPMLFYLYDVEDYRKNMRDFYFGTAMLPGMTASTQDRLEASLKKILDDMKKGGDGLMRYRTAVAAFNKRFNPVEDGHSAKRTVKALFGEE